MKKILILSGLCLLCLTGCSEEIDNLTYPYPDSKDVIVSLENYNKIETGMSEQEVWDIIGGECTNTGTTDMQIGEEYVTVSYGCNGKGSTGANVILMFQGGKLTSKNQAGLN